MNVATPMSMYRDPLSPRDDSQRLLALRRLRLLDTPRSESFDRVTRLVAISLGVPIALISLVDESRQWFKSRYGLDAVETPREISFCTYAVADRDTLVVPDATRDVRFATNPLVTNDPKIRFYAGVPLFTRDGHAIGTLCAIDRRPRDLNYEATDVLEDFASIAQDLVRAHEMVERVNTLLRYATERERLLDSAIEAVPLGLVFASPSGKIRRINSHACKWLGTNPRDSQGKTIADIVHPEDWSAHSTSIQAVAAGHLDRCDLKIRFQKKDGRSFDSHSSISLERSASGDPAYLLVVLQTTPEHVES